jgi:hypothetical protein
MIRRYLVGVVAAIAILAGPGAAWACSAAGDSTHIGMLTAVDVQAKSFTIIDAETSRPITFLSDDALLRDLKGAKGLIQVLYEEDGDKLRAIDVRY